MKTNFFKTFSCSLGLTLCGLTSVIGAQDPSSQNREVLEASSETAVETVPFWQILREQQERLENHKNYLRKNLQYVLALSRYNSYITSAENIFRNYTLQERAVRVATLTKETITNLSGNPTDGEKLAQHVGLEVVMQSKRPNGTPQQVLQRLISFFEQQLASLNYSSSLNYPFRSDHENSEDWF